MEGLHLKKPLLIAAKLAVTIVVFWWVIRELSLKPGGLKNLWINVRAADANGLLLGLGMFVILIVLGICRWQLLLRVQGIRISNYRVTWITAVGLFFNAFLIGVTGGDALKAWYVAEAAPDRKPQAILSIAVDRLIGILGLVILASVCVLFHLPVLWDDGQMRPLATLVLASPVVALLLIGVTAQRRRFATKSWWQTLWRLVPGKKLMSTLSESYDVYGKHPGELFMALLLSIGVHVGAVLAAWFVGGAIGIEGVGLADYFVYCPLINVFAAIPVTVGGLGLREGAFKFFFSKQGVPDPQAIALSLLFYAGMLVISLACGLIYLIGKPRSPLLNPQNV